MHGFIVLHVLDFDIQRSFILHMVFDRVKVFAWSFSRELAFSLFFFDREEKRIY